MGEGNEGRVGIERKVSKEGQGKQERQQATHHDHVADDALLCRVVYEVLGVLGELLQKSRGSSHQHPLAPESKLDGKRKGAYPRTFSVL